ncbi:unnamed protein product [Owenia fusiformis]|uniref:Sodium/nucleoside cotransporter n=1 Tax=Owenia fusiformis TaxID=6347 RepID=A0A8S4NWT2_OWEFU|nr:unnamed protein product [Owenia fusiformis]
MDNAGFDSRSRNGSVGQSSDDIRLEMNRVPSVDQTLSDKDKRNLPPYLSDKSTLNLATERRRSSKYEILVGNVQLVVHGFFTGDKKRTRVLLWICAAVFAVAWVVYLGFANAHNIQTAIPLDIITGFVIFCIAYYLVKKYFGKAIYKKCFKPLGAAIDRYWKVLKWILLALVLTSLGLILYFIVGKDRPKNLISVAGTVVIVLFCFVTSTNPAKDFPCYKNFRNELILWLLEDNELFMKAYISLNQPYDSSVGTVNSIPTNKVKWRPVLWGLSIQLIFGLLVLRWEPGYEAFSWMSNQIKVFLEYAAVGSEFVFGELYQNHPFVFEAIPQAIFFSACISILYHVGIVQQVILKLGWLMEITLGTTAVESLNATANIFISSVEAAVIIKDFLPRLTYSELHAVLCGGFATVAGVVMAIYISYGAPPEHVLSAAIMSAPAALALAKLSVPETEESRTKSGGIELEKPASRNVMEAASNGAVATITLIGHVCVNLIAFLGLLSFVNAILNYIGLAVGCNGLSFPFICSYVLRPLAFILGVSWEDSGVVAELMGTKIFINEFIAYFTMNEYYLAGKISDRSRAIATYVLCGFGSFGDIGINVGVFGAFAPTRRSELSGMGLRALVMGNLAGFLTACIAGMLYQGDELYVGGLTEAIRDNRTICGVNA